MRVVGWSRRAEPVREARGCDGKPEHPSREGGPAEDGARMTYRSHHRRAIGCNPRRLKAAPTGRATADRNEAARVDLAEVPDAQGVQSAGGSRGADALGWLCS